MASSSRPHVTDKSRGSGYYPRNDQDVLDVARILSRCLHHTHVPDLIQHITDAAGYHLYRYATKPQPSIGSSSSAAAVIHVSLPPAPTKAKVTRARLTGIIIDDDGQREDVRGWHIFDLDDSGEQLPRKQQNEAAVQVRVRPAEPNAPEERVVHFRKFEYTPLRLPISFYGGRLSPCYPTPYQRGDNWASEWVRTSDVVEDLCAADVAWLRDLKAGESLVIPAPLGNLQWTQVEVYFRANVDLDSMQLGPASPPSQPECCQVLMREASAEGGGNFVWDQMKLEYISLAQTERAKFRLKRKK